MMTTDTTPHKTKASEQILKLLFRKVTLLYIRLKITFYLETWLKCYPYWVATDKKKKKQQQKRDKNPENLKFSPLGRFIIVLLHAAFMKFQSFATKIKKKQIKQCPK